MQVPFDRPLEPARATEFIRRKALSGLDLSYTKHAKERLEERGLLIGDVLHVLKHGFVLEPGEPATQPGLFRYRMESTTPNSGGRTVCIVLIPSTSNAVKIVTAMWKDEQGR